MCGSWVCWNWVFRDVWGDGWVLIRVAERRGGWGQKL
jgi:hypothetical protein